MKRSALVRLRAMGYLGGTLLASGAAWACSGRDTSSPAAFTETGIEGVMLMDEVDGARFLAAYGPGASADDGLIHRMYRNSGGDEILDLVHHPGDLEHSFAEVLLLRSATWSSRVPSTTITRFVSSKGIHLGDDIDRVRLSLGAATEEFKTGETLTLVYRCTDARLCPALSTHNMPIYSARADFLGGRLVAYRFGFDYP